MVDLSEKPYNSSLQVAAEKWAKLGLKIVPVDLGVDENGGKTVRPLWKWQTDSYTGFESLSWAKANAYAVVLGVTPHGWLAYVDCDSDKPLPHDPLAALTKRFPELAQTYIEKTPHGFHVFLFLNKQPTHSNINLKNEYGLELHVNGLCFMAPSRYEAGEYSVYNNAEIADIPDFY